MTGFTLASPASSAFAFASSAFASASSIFASALFFRFSAASASCRLLLLLMNVFFQCLASADASQLASSPSFSPSLCNPRADLLFLADSTDRQAFFQCRRFAELPSIGFWERHFCPNEMHFAYETQQCTANSLPAEVNRDSNELFRIAILNGSCALGERCIGGTVCDQTQRRCLCPFGTVAVLENLYCAMVPTQQLETYHSYGTQNQQQRHQLQQQQRQFAVVHPFYGASRPTANQQLQSQLNAVGGTPFAALLAAVGPGSSCARGELCGGGSICLPSHGICMCPQGMENYGGGRCAMKSTQNGDKFEQNGGQIEKDVLGSHGQLIKASLGERCNENLGEICADQNARCEKGRCRCAVPMVELNGQCQRLTRQEAGPGEPCNEGQICAKGTECHPKLALCLCAEGNELLKNGSCVKPDETKPAEGTATVMPTTTTTAPAETTAPVMVSISSAEGTSSESPKYRKKWKEASSVGEKCSLNGDCLKGAYCNGNTQPPTCQCLSTHVNVDNRCEKVVYPGERGCETDLQCSAGYAGTRCIGRQCVCPPGSTAIGRSCIAAIAWPGERCNITNLMPVCSADSYCFEGQCVCNPPLHLFQKQCIDQREDIVPSLDDRNGNGGGEGNANSANAINANANSANAINANANDTNSNGDECWRDEQCQKGFICTKGRKCERCESDGRNKLIGDNCVLNFEEFGEKFDTKKTALDSEREEKKESRKKVEKRVSDKVTNFEHRTNAGGKVKEKLRGIGQTEMSGMEQIFSTLALLKSAVLDGGGLPGRRGKEKVEDGGRQRRESKDDDTSPSRTNTDGMMQRRRHSLPHNHRLEGEPCSPEDFCPKGAFCVDGHCRCPTVTSCKSVPSTFRAIGAQCVQSRDRCMGGSVCRNSSCICTDGSMPNVERTHCRQSPGGRCSAGQICSEQSKCLNGACQCRQGMKMALLGDGQRRHCVQTMAHQGQSCQNGEICTGKSICGPGKICSCPSDHKIVNGNRCEAEKTEKGDQQQHKDSEEKQLLDKIQRDDFGTNDGTEGKERRHTKTSRPGESCAGDELCTGGAFCSEKSICICAPGEIVQQKTAEGGGEATNCVLDLGPKKARDSGGSNKKKQLQQLMADPGQLCVEGGMECAGGAKCRNGICSCPEEHTLFSNECLPPRALPISVHKMHTHSPLFSPESMAKDISSSVSTAYDPNLQDPIPSKTVSPGAMCRLSLECPYRTECVRAVCRCQKGETIVNGMCRKIIHEVLPGGRCDTQKGLDCVGESHCFYGICVCLYGLVNIGNECANVDVLQRVTPGKRCVPGQHCLGKSKCVKGKCQCAKGQKIDTQLRRCVKLANPAAVTTQVLAYPSKAEFVSGPTSVVQIPLGNSNAILDDSNGKDEGTNKFIYAIPAALAAAAEEGKFQQILTANQMSINLLDPDMRSLLVKLIDQQKQSNETAGQVQKVRKDCGGESSVTNCQQKSGVPPPVFGTDSSIQSAIQPVPGTASSIQSAIQSVPGMASSLQSAIQPVPSIQGSAPAFTAQDFHQSVPNPLSSTALFSQLSSMSSPPQLQGQPGYFCAPGHNCHGGAICLSGLCICRPGFRPIDGLCQIAKVNLGEQCFLDEQCKANAFCIDGFCHCRAKFGGIRSASSSFGPISFRRRRCPTRPVAAVGEDCSKAQACGWNSICGKFSGVCECAVGMQNDQGACVAARRSKGIECLSSSNCHKFAFCDNGFCLCKVGFEHIDGFCLPPARPVVDDPKAYIAPETMALLWQKSRKNFGTENADKEREEASEAIVGLKNLVAPLQAVYPPMSAAGGFLPADAAVEQRMDESLLLGDNSLDTMQNAILRGTIASARQPFSAQRHNNKRFERNDLSEAEQLDDGQLYQIGFTSDQNSFSPKVQQQLHFAHITPPTIQYFPAHLTARGTKTMKLTKRKDVKGKTYNKAKAVGQGYSNGQQKGHKVAMPGEYCGNQERQCLGNSMCLRGWCQCAEGVHVERGGMCANEPGKSMMPAPAAAPSELLHKVHRPFDSCFSNSRCVHGASCVRSAALLFVQKLGPFCQCHPGLIFQHNQCVPRRPEMQVAQPGDQCHSPATICDSGSICGDEKICKCPAYRKLINGLCVHLALPGESCASGEFCADGAICAPGLNACVCQVGWTVRNGKCRKGKKLRKRTMKGDERREQRRSSDERQMEIKREVQTAASSSMAKKLIPLGESCHFDSDCANVLNAKCSPGARRCACKDGFLQLYSSICVPTNRIRLPGEECISSAHFCAEQSWCKNGRCACIQRDSDAVEGHCVPKISTKWAAIRRRQPPRQLQHKAKSNTSVEEANHRRRQKVSSKIAIEPKETEEKEETEMANEQKQKRKKKKTSDRNKDGDEHREEQADLGMDLEWDYALGEPMGVEGAADNFRPLQSNSVVPILPGSFCDAFSQCGEGAECFFGKCQCTFRGHHLAFVDGVTKCVKEDGKNENGDEKKTDGREKEKRRQRRHRNSFMKMRGGDEEHSSAEKKRRNFSIEKEIWRKSSKGGKEEKEKGEKRVKAAEDDDQSTANCTNCVPQSSNNKTLLSVGEFRRKPKDSLFIQQRSQKNPKGTKIFVPGELCGPLDTCTGGSSCVEGFCLCPAGTRPSPASANCESIAQQRRKMSKPTATTENRQNNDREISSRAPTPITDEWTDKLTSANWTGQWPTTAAPSLSSRLTNANNNNNNNNATLLQMSLINRNLTGEEIVVSSPQNPMSTNAKMAGLNVSATSFQNGTKLNAEGISRTTNGTNPTMTVRNYNTDGEQFLNSTNDENRAKLIILKKMRGTASTKSSSERVYSRPSESCSSGEICTGGSICDQHNKVCECPAVKPLLRNHICIPSNEPPMIEAKAAKPGELCNSETKCMGNSVCAEGSCRCQRDFRLEEDSHCTDGAQRQQRGRGRQDSNKNSGGMLPPAQLSLLDAEVQQQQQQSNGDSTQPTPPISSMPRRIRMHAKPRISGPPLQRPSSLPPPPSSSSSSSSSSLMPGGKLAPAGTNGVCPPGNSPTKDQTTGLIMQCNGMTPKCPPKSYCFVTGVASEVYNCCKSY